MGGGLGRFIAEDSLISGVENDEIDLKFTISFWLIRFLQIILIWSQT